MDFGRGARTSGVGGMGWKLSVWVDEVGILRIQNNA